MAPITSVSGSLGSSNSTTPFEGFTRMIQHRVDRLGQFVDTYSPLPIEWLLIVLPFVIGILRVVTPMLRQTATETYQRMQRVVIRDITAVFVNGYMINGIPTDRNALLQNAVLMYLQRHVWSRKPLPASAWRNKTAVVLLIDPFRSRVNEYSSSPFNVTDTQSSDSDDDRDIAMRGVARSKKFMDRLLLAKLPLGTWVKADDVSGIEISFRRCLTKYGKSAASERTLSLMARGRDASQRIDQFTQKSLSYFLTQLPQLTKSDRFFFELQPSADGGLRDDKKSLVFKRYVLSADKNLDTLFFPERNNMVKLIDDFVFRRGRFAVEGFPYKLGVLLHGPHGTGKTAFVKALAAYTGRHVVSVPLGLVETNQQLYDIFLTRNYTCVGESESQRLKLEEVIFLFDDVDAASPLVCSRQRRRKVYRRPDAVLRSSGHLMPDLYGAEERDHADLLPALDLEADGSDVEDDAEEVLEEQVVELTDRVPELGTTAIGSDFLSAGTSAQPTTTSAVSAGSAPLTAVAVDSKKSLFGMFESADKLDLSGLLNVLDGVVDTPGRIVVMVTNHPERLDPALVRPGRMSSRLRLDCIRFDAVVKMTGLHFGERDPPALTAEEILDRLEDRVLSEAAQRRAAGKNGNSGTTTPGSAPSKSLVDKAAATEEDASRLNDDDDDDDDAVENTISMGKDKTATATTTTDATEGSDAAAALIRGSTRNATSVPMGMAAARVPHRSLSENQVKQLREAIAQVEKEAEAAKAKSHDSAEGAMTSLTYRFKIAPSEVELLCSQTETLEEFIQALQSLMRGQLKL